VIYGDRTTRLAEQSLASVAIVGEKALARSRTKKPNLLATSPLRDDFR